MPRNALHKPGPRKMLADVGAATENVGCHISIQVGTMTCARGRRLSLQLRWLGNSPHQSQPFVGIRVSFTRARLVPQIGCVSFLFSNHGVQKSAIIAQTTTNSVRPYLQPPKLPL